MLLHINNTVVLYIHTTVCVLINPSLTFFSPLYKIKESWYIKEILYCNKLNLYLNKQFCGTSMYFCCIADMNLWPRSDVLGNNQEQQSTPDPFTFLLSMITYLFFPLYGLGPAPIPRESYSLIKIIYRAHTEFAVYDMQLRLSKLLGMMPRLYTVARFDSSSYIATWIVPESVANELLNTLFKKKSSATEFFKLFHHHDDDDKVLTYCMCICLV